MMAFHSLRLAVGATAQSTARVVARRQQHNQLQEAPYMSTVEKYITFSVYAVSFFAYPIYVLFNLNPPKVEPSELEPENLAALEEHRARLAAKKV